jgi:hypothetical protein
MGHARFRSGSIASILEFRPFVRLGGKSGYLAFIKLASIRIWLRAYESTL